MLRLPPLDDAGQTPRKARRPVMPRRLARNLLPG